MSTNTLDFDIIDDLASEISANPDDYQDQQNPAPLVAGNYRFRLEKVSVRRERDSGAVILKDGKYPTYVIDMVEILEPVESMGRKVALFQDITTKPFLRGSTQASKIMDLLRAFDATRSYSGLTEARDALKEFADSGATAVGKFDWTANDYQGAKDALTAAGITARYAELNAEDQQTANAIYKSHKLRGMKKFPPVVVGGQTVGYQGSWESPSGNVVEARAEIVRFYPSNENVTL